jgi:pterin-4a-carbinolamine dehydratase
VAEDKTVLSVDEVDSELESLEGWSRTESIIARDFIFANFRDITSFLNHLTKTITEMNHHPDFSLNTGSKTISVSVTTQSEKAITRCDIQFAATLNAWTPALS